MKFSEKIVFMRKKRKISQDRLAKKMGVSRQTIYKWEADLNTPEFNKIEKLADILDISYNLLLDDSIDLNVYFNESSNSEQISKESTIKEEKNQIDIQEKRPDRRSIFLIAAISITVIALASVFIIIGIINSDKSPDNKDTDSDVLTDTSIDSNTDTSTDTDISIDTDILACNHNWTEWDVIDNGNCLIPQTLERTCNKCEEKETKEGTVVEEHDKNNRWFTKTPATCFDDEVEYTSCYKCGSEFYRQGALALGHTYENERCIRCQKSQYTEGIEYGIKNGTAYVSGYTGDEEIISISPYYISPDDNIKYSVTMIRELSSETAKELIIPEGVVEIRNINCPQLAGIKLPTTLKKIFDDTFASCINITRVYIYDLKSWCQVSPVMNVMEGKTIFKYPYNMYLNDELLTEVHLTSDIYYVNSSVFENCSSIKKLTMDPDTENIRSIGARAFYNTGLEYAQIDCTALEKDAFSFCYYLTTVDIYVRASVPHSSFNACFHLCEITLNITV